MLKADFHIHTQYSRDSVMSLETVISNCQKKQINCIAVADHGTIKGAVKMKEIAPFKIIVAEEIMTPVGEIMGLFLTEEIPSHISPEEAIKRIKEQNGLVCIPHPFDRLRGAAIHTRALESLIPYIDVIEVYNSRAGLARDCEKARLFAEKYRFPATAGSDAHTPGEIGHAWVEMPDFNNQEEFKAALAKGKITGRKSSYLVHVPSTLLKIKKLVLG